MDSFSQRRRRRGRRRRRKEDVVFHGSSRYLLPLGAPLPGQSDFHTIYEGDFGDILGDVFYFDALKNRKLKSELLLHHQQKLKIERVQEKDLTTAQHKIFVARN